MSPLAPSLTALGKCASTLIWDGSCGCHLERPCSHLFLTTLKPPTPMAGSWGLSSKATNAASSPPGSRWSCTSWDTPASQLLPFPVPSLYLSCVPPCPWMPPLGCLHLVSDPAGGWFNSLTQQKSPPATENKKEKRKKKVDIFCLMGEQPILDESQQNRDAQKLHPLLQLIPPQILTRNYIIILTQCFLLIFAILKKPQNLFHRTQKHKAVLQQKACRNIYRFIEWNGCCASRLKSRIALTICVSVCSHWPVHTLASRGWKQQLKALVVQLKASWSWQAGQLLSICWAPKSSRQPPPASRWCSVPQSQSTVGVLTFLLFPGIRLVIVNYYH